MQTVPGRLLRPGELDRPARALPPEPDHLRRAADGQPLDRVLHRDRRRGRRRLAGDHGLRPAHLQPEPHCDADDGSGRQHASGLDVTLKVPQTQSPTAPSPSEIRDVTMTLPDGFSLAPNAANGKVACADTELSFDNGGSSALSRVRQDRHLDHRQLGAARPDPGKHLHRPAPARADLPRLRHRRRLRHARETERPRSSSTPTAAGS